MFLLLVLSVRLILMLFSMQLKTRFYSSPLGEAKGKLNISAVIDAEDIGGEITVKLLSEQDRHQNRVYSITGPEAIDYYNSSKMVSEELVRGIIYANSKPSLL